MVKNLPANARVAGSVSGFGMIPWTRKWQPTPVLLPGKFPGTEEPGGLQSTGSQRVGMTEQTAQQQTWKN